MRSWLDLVNRGLSARRLTVDAGLHAAAGLVDFLPGMKRRMAGTRLIEDVEYACHGGQRLRLDVLRPAGPGPHPALMYLHGGAFTVGSKRTHRALAAAYASRGYVVFNVDYRLAPESPFPAAVEDACAAWSWITDHALGYGGDSARMALAGESAGANLALAVLLACCTPRPEAFAAPLYARGVQPLAALLYCGFLQASRPGRYRRAGVSALAAQVAEDAGRSYLGRSVEHPGPEHALADPLCIVEAMQTPTRLPALFIAAGQDDPVVEDSQRLERALLRLGSPASAHYYPGEPHAFHVLFWRDNAIRCWRDSFEFLHRHLPVHAPPVAAVRNPRVA